MTTNPQWDYAVVEQDSLSYCILISYTSLTECRHEPVCRDEPGSQESLMTVIAGLGEKGGSWSRRPTPFRRPNAACGPLPSSDCMTRTVASWIELRIHFRRSEHGDRRSTGGEGMGDGTERRTRSSSRLTTRIGPRSIEHVLPDLCGHPDPDSRWGPSREQPGAGPPRAGRRWRAPSGAYCLPARVACSSSAHC